MIPTQSLPQFVSKDEGTVWNVLGMPHQCKVHGGATGGAYSVIQINLPPGGGPPLHVHHREDEIFCALEGSFEIRCGQDTLRIGAGDVAALPKNVPHTFRNVGTATGRMLVTIVPGGFENFFEDIDRLSQRGAPDMGKVVELARQYGLEFV